MNYQCLFLWLLEIKPLYNPVCRLFGQLVIQSVGQLVCHDFLKGRNFSLPCCSYRINCWYIILILPMLYDLTNYLYESNYKISLWCSIIVNVTPLSVGRIVGRSLRWLVGRSVIISCKSRRLHFHPPMGALFFIFSKLCHPLFWV